MQMSGLSDSVKASAITEDTYSWTMAPWVIIAPLGFDVVPEV